MAKAPKEPSRASRHLFFQISESYLAAFAIIHESDDFRDSDRRGRIAFWPLSQLMGHALETALKGLIVYTEGEVDRSHDLCWLLDRAGQLLTEKLDERLADLVVPADIVNDNLVTRCPHLWQADENFNYDPEDEASYESSLKASIEAIRCEYRKAHFHFCTLNSLYNRPFVTRYPVPGAYPTPDFEALHRIALVLLDALREQGRAWRPE